MTRFIHTNFVFLWMEKNQYENNYNEFVLQYVYTKIPIQPIYTKASSTLSKFQVKQRIKKHLAI